jgi:outer membrane murein-binding lipoprotein Lpp
LAASVVLASLALAVGGSSGWEIGEQRWTMSQVPNGWHGPERRTNLRLRAVINELQAAVRENRSAIDALSKQIADLREDLEMLKRRPAAPHE